MIGFVLKMLSALAVRQCPKCFPSLEELTDWNPKRVGQFD